MADNIQRSRGRPSNYKFDRGGTPTEFGPFIGVVKNNIDPTRSGRLQVYIEQFAGDDPEDSTLWRTVMYVPPFYGVTPRNNATGSAGTGSYKGNQQSYGMWFTPPDIGVQVICFFVAGDPNQGYYTGCVPDPGVTHMIPAIGASRKFVTKNQQQQTEIDAAEAEQMPVVEINAENAAAYESPRFFDEPKPIHDYVYAILYNQGLLGDYIRGPISSSAQRESPSSVFGVSTPGRPIYQGGLSEREIKDKLAAGDVDLADIKVEGRRGGHSIVLDDGDLRGRDNLIRIRTAKGHQITMSDEADCLYIIAANGQTWIELGSEGTVDVYSTNSVNVRSQGEINLHADKNININAGENLNIRAGNIQIESQNTTKLTSVSDFTVYSKTKVGVLSDGMIALQSDRGGWKCAGGLAMKAARIDLNGGAAPESVTAPKPIPEFKLDDTKFVDGQGWEIQPEKIETIVPRAPTHEPYPYHNRGVPVEIEVTAQAAQPPSPQVAAALESTNSIPVTAPPAAASSLPGAAPLPTAATLASGGAPAVSAGLPAGTAAAINAADVLKTPIADVKIGSLDKASVTGLLAQAKSSVGQASNVISVDKGIGQFGLKPEQLESAGFLKPGTLSSLQAAPAPLPTPEDIAEAERIVAEGGNITPEQVAQNRKINSMLSSPTLWTGKSGVTGLTNLLGNEKLQNAAQQGLLANSLEGLKSSGLATGLESPAQLSGLVQSATKLGVKSVDDFVKGVAPPDIASSMGATIKGAEFANNFVQEKAGDFAGFAKAAKVAENTVNRDVVDQQVTAALGDAKIPPPEFKPVEREPDEPTAESQLVEEVNEVRDEALAFLDSVKVLADAAIEESKVLDAQQPLTQAQIDGFRALRDEYRNLFNSNWKQTYVPKLAALEDAKYDPIRSYVNSILTSFNRLVSLLVAISQAQRDLIAQWEGNSASATFT